MVYRIRYRTGDAGEAEIAVEANSPNEALVKFRHTQRVDQTPGDMGDSVTSVCAEEFPSTGM